MKARKFPIALCAIALAWLCAGAALAADNPFIDVSEEHVFYDAVLWAYSNDVTKGVSADEFSPKSSCNRGQVVTFLWRASGRPEPKTKSNPFTDVRPDSYCYKAVLWAVERGITNGTAADKFSPAAPCTFAHVLVFLWRANGQPESASNAFAGDEWYSGALAWANRRGLLAELPLNLSEACPRACIVTYLYRNQTGQSVSVEDMIRSLSKSRILGMTLEEAAERECDGEWLFLYLEHESDEATVMSDICATEILETGFASAVMEGWADTWLTFYYYAFTDRSASQGDGLSGAWIDEGMDDGAAHVSALRVLQRGNFCAFSASYRGGYHWVFMGALENGAVRYTNGILSHKGELERTDCSGEVRVEGESLYWAEDDGESVRYYRDR